MSNVQLMEDLYDAFGRGDMATVLSAMDPGMQWREAEGTPYQPSGSPWLGPDAILQLRSLPRIGAVAWAPDESEHAALAHGRRLTGTPDHHGQCGRQRSPDRCQRGARVRAG